MKMEQVMFDNPQLSNEIGHLTTEGRQYHESRNLTDAIRCYEKAYQLSRELNNDEVERTCAFNLGAMFIADGEFSKGLSYLHKATPPNGQKDSNGDGDLFLNFGLAHEKLGDMNKSLENYEKAFKRYKSFESGNLELLNQCFNKCIDIYTKWKKHADAAKLCQEMADVYESNEDGLHRAEKLCEKADHLRRCPGVTREEILGAAEECMNVINTDHPQGDACLTAGMHLYKYSGLKAIVNNCALTVSHN